MEFGFVRPSTDGPGGTGSKEKKLRIELEVRRELLDYLASSFSLVPPSATDNVYVATCPGQSCHRRRPDLAWAGIDRTVFVECDEHSHKDRLPVCELSKTDEQGWGREGKMLPTLLVRFNPHAKAIEDTVPALAEIINRYCTAPLTNLGFEEEEDNLRIRITYINYEGRAAQEHIKAAKKVELSTGQFKVDTLHIP